LNNASYKKLDFDFTNKKANWASGL
jgi:hypothetical protein